MIDAGRPGLVGGPHKPGGLPSGTETARLDDAPAVPDARVADGPPVPDAPLADAPPVPDALVADALVADALVPDALGADALGTDAPPVAAVSVSETARPAPVAAPALGRRWAAAGMAAVAVAVVAGVIVGPVRLGTGAVVRELLGLRSGLSPRQSTIVWQVRLPRVVLGLLVGAVLSLAGGAYQATFRNPLADPYLLGVAGGAGFGATLVIVSRGALGGDRLVPVGAFAGALVAMALTYALGAAGGRASGPGVGGRRTSTTSLVLAGVAVAAFFTALQTYLQQRDQADIRRVYTWILGRLSTSGWHEVLVLLPYAAVSCAVLLACRRWLDVLSVGDDEAISLGVNPHRLRLTVVVAATLGTAAAVAVSGLIVFVGIIVPHTVRLLAGHSARTVLPLSLLFGAAFLALTDLIARTVLAPAELPIGVVTAFLGAPFFVVVLRTSRDFS